MAALKRGLVVGGAAIAGLLALAGIAKAASKPSGGGGPQPEDPYSPEACAGYRAARGNIANSCAQLEGQIVEVDAARIAAADAGDDAQLANLNAIRATLVGQLQNCKAQLSSLDSKIAQCA